MIAAAVLLMFACGVAAGLAVALLPPTPAILLGGFGFAAFVFALHLARTRIEVEAISETLARLHVGDREPWEERL